MLELGKVVTIPFPSIVTMLQKNEGLSLKSYVTELCIANLDIGVVYLKGTDVSRLGPFLEIWIHLL